MIFLSADSSSLSRQAQGKDCDGSGLKRGAKIIESPRNCTKTASVMFNRRSFRYPFHHFYISMGTKEIGVMRSQTPAGP